jgi:hypothetical protein
MRRLLRTQRRRWIAAGLAALLLVPPTLAWALPVATTCALIAGLPGHRALPDGSLVDPARPRVEQARLQRLRAQARARIAAFYGMPRAAPAVVFIGDAPTFAPLNLNPTAGTRFLPGGACVYVGPHGENLDVLAHELMHAEVFERVGFWTRVRGVPTWFDEGIAMQVDGRDAFDLDSHARTPERTAFVRELATSGQFFAADGPALTANYAAAKAQVAHWLQSTPPRGLYGRLERLRRGERFAEAMAP